MINFKWKYGIRKNYKSRTLDYSSNIINSEIFRSEFILIRYLLLIKN